MASKPNMVAMLKYSHQEFKTILIKMLRTLIDKIERMQKKIGNVSIEMEILRIKKIEIKNIVNKLKCL